MLATALLEAPGYIPWTDIILIGVTRRPQMGQGNLCRSKHCPLVDFTPVGLLLDFTFRRHEGELLDVAVRWICVESVHPSSLRFPRAVISVNRGLCWSLPTATRGASNMIMPDGFFQVNLTVRGAVLNITTNIVSCPNLMALWMLFLKYFAEFLPLHRFQLAYGRGFHELVYRDKLVDGFPWYLSSSSASAGRFVGFATPLLPRISGSCPMT